MNGVRAFVEDDIPQVVDLYRAIWQKPGSEVAFVFNLHWTRIRLGILIK